MRRRWEAKVVQSVFIEIEDEEYRQNLEELAELVYINFRQLRKKRFAYLRH